MQIPLRKAEGLTLLSPRHGRRRYRRCSAALQAGQRPQPEVDSVARRVAGAGGNPGDSESSESAFRSRGSWSAHLFFPEWFSNHLDDDQLIREERQHLDPEFLRAPCSAHLSRVL